MAVLVLHRHNATAGAVPAAASLTPRELAVNSGDGRVYTKTGAGTVLNVGQPFNAVAITGGAIDGTNIGATTAGTLRGTTLALTTAQTAKHVLAAPNGANGAPGWRQLQQSDLADPLNQKSVTISSPTASEKVPLFFTAVALTVAEIRSIVLGSSPSVTFSVRHGADMSAAGTEVVTNGTTVTNTTTGLSTTAFNAPAVPAGSWVWVTTSAVSGTVNAFHVTVRF